MVILIQCSTFFCLFFFFLNGPLNVPPVGLLTVALIHSALA